MGKDSRGAALDGATSRRLRRVTLAVTAWLRQRPSGSWLLVCGLYALMSMVYWGLPILGHWTTRTVGSGTDPLNIFVWSMAWWPYALTHGVNPLLLKNVFVPLVTNAGWRTVIPLLSVALAPVTLTAGPVAAYNVAMLAAPALTATTTYLLMTEWVSQRWVVLWAGYMVGFSSYEVSQTLAHLNLTFTALVPLAVWLGVRLYRLSAGAAPWRYIAALAAVLVGQFLISTEILLTLTLFGFGGLFLAWLVLPLQRGRLGRVMGWVLAAYGVFAAALSPWLWMMAQHIPFQRVGSAYAVNSTNLLNLVVPTPVTIGGQWFGTVSGYFAGGSRVEASGYMGIPLVALMAWASSRWRRAASVRVVAYLGLVTFGLSLGPTLHVGGWTGPALPWRVVSRLPVFDVISTSRFMLYASLAGAGLVGWAVSQMDRSRRPPAVAMVLAAVALMPNLSRPGWWGSAAVPRLIASPTLLRRYVAPGEPVMVLPYFFTGRSTWWQAASGFRLTLADGYLYSGLPSPFALMQLPNLLLQHDIPPGHTAPRQFDTLLQMGHVGVVLVQQPAGQSETSMLRHAGLQDEGTVGGVGIWRVPNRARGQLASPARLFRLAVSAIEAAQVRDVSRIVSAADRSVAAGHPVGTLTLARLERQGFLPPGEGHGAYGPWQQTVWGTLLRAEPRHFVVVVHSFTPAAFGHLVRHAGPGLIAHQFVPSPRLSRSQPAGMTLGNGVLTFNAAPPPP